MTILAGIEMGGTSCAIALAKDQYTDIIAGERHVVNTTSPEETLRAIAEWLCNRSFDAIGVASFGPIDLNRSSKTYGYITTSPKPGWNYINVLGLLTQFLTEAKRLRGQSWSPVPVGFDTDVNAAAFAEQRRHQVQSCAYVTVGTGIGVGLIVEGKPVHGVMHPELGHCYVPRCPSTIVAFPGEDAFPGVCSYHGACLEGLATNKAIAARLGKNIQELPYIGDDHAVWILVSYYLAHLCVTLTLAFAPHRIVLGGGVMRREVVFPRIRQFVRQLLNGYIAHDLVDSKIDEYIIHSPYGNDAGLIGALFLADGALHSSS